MLNDVNAGSCLLLMPYSRRKEAQARLDVYSIYITLWAPFHVLLRSNGNNMKANGIVKVQGTVLQTKMQPFLLLFQTHLG